MNPFVHATLPDMVVFAVGTLMVLGGALRTVLAREPIQSALGLIVSFFGIATLFVQQHAHFLAAAQVMVYAGAIVVLFLFVIMLLGVDRVESITRTSVRFSTPIAVLLFAGFTSAMLFVARGDWRYTSTPLTGQTDSGTGGTDAVSKLFLHYDSSDIHVLANALFTRYLFLFEATSLLLVVAVVGAIALVRKPHYAHQNQPYQLSDAEEATKEEFPKDERVGDERVEEGRTE